MELVQEAKVLLVHMQCEECNEGFMEEDETDMNVILATYPPQYPHKCNKCGYVENYFKCYPHQMLVPVGELRDLTPEERGE